MRGSIWGFGCHQSSDFGSEGSWGSLVISSFCFVRSKYRDETWRYGTGASATAYALLAEDRRALTCKLYGLTSSSKTGPPAATAPSTSVTIVSYIKRRKMGTTRIKHSKYRQDGETKDERQVEKENNAGHDSSTSLPCPCPIKLCLVLRDLRWLDHHSCGSDLRVAREVLPKGD
jgi:hypothetical protein